MLQILGVASSLVMRAMPRRPFYAEAFQETSALAEATDVSPKDMNGARLCTVRTPARSRKSATFCFVLPTFQFQDKLLIAHGYRGRIPICPPTTQETMLACHSINRADLVK